MDIIISNSSGKPIYEQITSQIKQMIMQGELKEGDALPSMRLLADQRIDDLQRALDDPVFRNHLLKEYNINE